MKRAPGYGITPATNPAFEEDATLSDRDTATGYTLTATLGNPVDMTILYDIGSAVAIQYFKFTSVFNCFFFCFLECSSDGISWSPFGSGPRAFDGVDAGAS